MVKLNPLTAVTIALFLLLLALLFCLMQPGKAQPFTATPTITFIEPEPEVTPTIKPEPDPIWLYEVRLPLVYNQVGCQSYCQPDVACIQVCK